MAFKNMSLSLNCFKRLLYMQKWSDTKSLQCSAVPLVKATVYQELGLPDPPRKPVPPYIQFSVALKDAYAGTSASDRSRVLSKQWAELTADEKAKYLKQYDTEREMYNTRYSSYLGNLTEEQRENVKLLKKRRIVEKNSKKIASQQKQTMKEVLEELGKPKLPMNSYMLYLDSLKRPQDTSRTEFVSKASRDWKNMGDAEQEKFKLAAQKLMDSYMKDLEQWEKRMVKIGRQDLIRKSSLSSKPEGVFPASADLKPIAH